MFLSVFEIFKIGIGPSSSHTMGPMVAAGRFLELLRRRAAGGGKAPTRLRCRLHGSLAWTGKGHASDRAVVLGLAGATPESLDPDRVEGILADIARRRSIAPDGLPPFAFDPDRDVVLDFGPPLPGHANGLVFEALADDDEVLLAERYFSVGGGFVLTERELAAPPAVTPDVAVPFPFADAAQMLAMGEEAGLSIAEMKRRNETVRHGAAALETGLEAIWQAMRACLERGLARQGVLPGGLEVRRRAAGIYEKLQAERHVNRLNPHTVNDWIQVYAMAVNEENAAGGRVVTSPTNGAAGVVPAVLFYFLEHCMDASEEQVPDFLLTAAAIGGLIKHNASISGAEVGCQGEVGSAAAMAAAGLCAVLGGSNAQIENAAEIALEHHLGMTCDPVGGLVQVPCIERNGLGAVKAIAAASLSLRGDGRHFMPLDNCIESMRQTGLDMSEKYKETAQGGLAVNLPAC